MTELDELYKELDIVQSMSEDAVCMRFNVDSKQEYIDMLNEDIDRLEDAMDDMSGDDDYDDYELERERTTLCISQGISRFC